MDQELLEQLKKVKEHGRFFKPENDSDEANEKFASEVNRLLELRREGYIEFTDKAVVKNSRTEKDYYMIVGPVKITYEGEKALIEKPQNQVINKTIDVSIIIALQEEFQHLIDELDGNYQTVRDEVTGAYFYLFDRLNSTNTHIYSCVAAFAGDMGPQKAASLTRRLISNYNPPVLVMIGIAGGISKDVRIGDIVVADQIDAYLDNSKALNHKANDESFDFLSSGNVYRSSGDLIHFVKNFKFAHPALHKQWQERCENLQTSLLSKKPERSSYIKNQIIRDAAIIEVGHMASGPTVSSSKNFINWLKRRDRKFLAVEMEAAGLMAEVSEEIKQRKTLIIRGISDFGDDRKEELDETHEGVFRSLAMRNAIQLLWVLMDADSLH